MFLSNEKFERACKKLVREYTIEHIGKTDEMPEFDVYIVWSAFILGYQKALLSTTISDGMYYEVTYNKAKSELYLDAYKKFENRCMSVEIPGLPEEAVKIGGKETM